MQVTCARQGDEPESSGQVVWLKQKFVPDATTSGIGCWLALLPPSPVIVALIHCTPESLILRAWTRPDTGSSSNSRHSAVSFPQSNFVLLSGLPAAWTHVWCGRPAEAGAEEFTSSAASSSSGAVATFHGAAISAASGTLLLAGDCCCHGECAAAAGNCCCCSQCSAAGAGAAAAPAVAAAAAAAAASGVLPLRRTPKPPASMSGEDRGRSPGPT